MSCREPLVMAGSSSSSFPHFGTRCIHAGQEPEQWECLPVVPPIFTNTTYKQHEPGKPVSSRGVGLATADLATSPGRLRSFSCSLCLCSPGSTTYATEIRRRVVWRNAWLRAKTRSTVVWLGVVWRTCRRCAWVVNLLLLTWWERIHLHFSFSMWDSPW